MEGGRLIAQGKYGCVYEPQLVCKPKTKKIIRVLSGRKVGKITEKDEARREIDASKILATVPHAEDYFVYIDSECEPAKIGDQKEKDLGRCDILKEEALTKLSMITMPYAGISLLQVPSNLIQDKYMRYSQHLLEAGVWMLMKNIVHFDLHMNNIVVKDKPRIIDFGYVWTPNNLDSKNVSLEYRVYNPVINHESPEVAYVNGRLEGISPDVLIDDIVDRKSILTVEMNLLGGTNLQKMKSQFRQFVMNSSVLQKNDLVTFFKVYWTKFDAWALGVALCKMCSDAIMDATFVQNIYGPNKEKIRRVIEGLLNVDPGFRFDAVEALQVWAPDSAVLKTKEVQDWLSAQTAIRTRLEMFSAAPAALTVLA